MTGEPEAAVDPVGEEAAIAAYRRVLSAADELLSDRDDTGRRAAFYDGYEYPLTCYREDARPERRPHETLLSYTEDEAQRTLGIFSARIDVLRAGQDDVLMLDHGVRFTLFGLYGGQLLYERVVWMRWRDGRWRIAAETSRDHAECLEPGDAARVASASVPEERARCEAARGRCVRRRARACDDDRERLGYDACERCAVDECPCELARCFGPPEAVERMCAGLQ